MVMHWNEFYEENEMIQVKQDHQGNQEINQPKLYLFFILITTVYYHLPNGFVFIGKVKKSNSGSQALSVYSEARLTFAIGNLIFKIHIYLRVIFNCKGLHLQITF